MPAPALARLLLAGLGAALLLAAAPARAAAPPPAEARALKDQGDQRRKAGDADGALAAYRAALKLHGGYAEAYEAVGEVRYAQRRYAEAIEAFGYAVEIDPAYALAWYNLGFAARKGGEPARARTAYERYTALRPADPDGHYGLAESLRALGEREAAAREYQLFVDIAGPIPAQAKWVEAARAHLAELRAPAAAPPEKKEEAAPPIAAPVGALAALAAGAAVLPASAPGAAVVAPAVDSSSSSPSPRASPPAGERGEGAQASPTATATPTSTATPTPTATPTSTPTPTPTPSPSPSPSPSPVTVPPPSPPPYQAPLPVPPSATPLPLSPPTQAVIDKIGAGDRATLAGDHRTALFAYQDAVHLEPANPAALVRLGRAYLALRYPDKAKAQADLALRLDPTSAEAAKLLEEIANPPKPVTPAPRPPAPPPAPHVYKLPLEQPPGPPPAPVPTPPATPAPSAPGAPSKASAAQLYRSAVAYIGQREFARAEGELTLAIQLDPDLAVAYAARGSARFGQGRTRDAAEDYEAAVAKDGRMATPLWGLAECYRLAGDPRAADAYARYASSPASDVRDDLRELARRRAAELGGP